MFAGNLWILAKSWTRKAIEYPQRKVAVAGEIPVGGVKLFEYSNPGDQCILVRTAEEEYRGVQPEMHASLVRGLILG